MLIDASHTLREGMARVPLLPPFRIEPVSQIAEGKPLNTAQLHLATHVGTHIDAPAHAFDGMPTIDELPLTRFHGPGAVIGVRRAAGEEIGVADVAEAPVEVLPGDIVILRTGWDEKFQDPGYHDHPYPSVELAEWLLSRRVKMLGVDCLTVDAPPSRRAPDFAFPVHRLLLGNEILIIENLANLSAAEDTRVNVWAFPLKVGHGDAGHARVVLETVDG